MFRKVKERLRSGMFSSSVCCGPIRTGGSNGSSPSLSLASTRFASCLCWWERTRFFDPTDLRRPLKYPPPKWLRPSSHAGARMAGTDLWRGGASKPNLVFRAKIAKYDRCRTRTAPTKTHPSQCATTIKRSSLTHSFKKRWNLLPFIHFD
jgi:hypothetical protein